MYFADRRGAMVFDGNLAGWQSQDIKNYRYLFDCNRPERPLGTSPPVMKQSQPHHRTCGDYFEGTGNDGNVQSQPTRKALPKRLQRLRTWCCRQRRRDPRGGNRVLWQRSLHLSSPHRHR